MRFPRPTRAAVVVASCAALLLSSSPALGDERLAPAAADAPAVAQPAASGGDAETGATPTPVQPPHPEHVDPAPPGVDVTRKVSTATLVDRMETRAERKLDATPAAEDGGGLPGTAARTTTPFIAASNVPPGVSALPGLSGHVARSCAGTGSDGLRVHAMYVVEADKPDRFSSVLPLLQDELANVDDTFALSAAETGGSRRVRWVFDSSTTCEPVITKVVVPAGSLASFSSSVTALRNAGYTSPQRKYLFFADTAVLCGVGHVYTDDRRVGNANDGNAAAMFARVDTGCWQASATYGSTAAHELMHTIGGVQLSAPHATSYGHCTDRYDLMCYNDGSGAAMSDVCSTSHSTLFDCRSDDYFHTAPAAGSYLATYWNTADSSFLDSGSAPAPTPVAPPTTTEPATTPDPVTAPTVTVAGPTSVLPGLPAQLVATGSATGTYAWSVSDRACAPPGALTGAVLDLVCPAEQAVPVQATVTYVRSDGQTATATHTVSPEGARTTLVQSLMTTTPVARRRADVVVTAKLLHGSTPVRGRVRISASSDGKSWRELAPHADTGLAGAASFVVRIDRTTYLRSRAVVAAGSAWVPSRDPVLRLTVSRSATRLALGVRQGDRPVVTGRLLDVRTKKGLARAKVTLQYRTSQSGKWRALGTFTTSRSGAVSAAVRPRTRTFYRWHFAGSSSHAPGMSSARGLR